MYTNGQKITGPAKPSLKRHWGRTKARCFFDFKCIVQSDDFDLIWWHGIELAMASFPKMYREFVTKQVSGWCGTNNKNSLWDLTIDNTCPNCGLIKETSKHMICCKHEGCVTLFHKSMVVVTSCLENAHADLELIDIYESYLAGQGSVAMQTCTPHGSRFSEPPRSTICLDGTVLLRDTSPSSSSPWFNRFFMDGIHATLSTNGASPL